MPCRLLVISSTLARARVFHSIQHLPVTLNFDDGAQDLLARLAHHAGDDVGQLNVHLRQRFVHVLNVASLAAQQHAALAPERTQHAHLLGRAESPAQQAAGHQLLQPLTVEYVGLAARYVLDVACVDQHRGEAARLQQLEQWDPIHACGFLRHGVDAARHQPIGSRQSAIALRSTVKLENSRTGPSSRSGGTATTCAAMPMSIPAALGSVIVSAARDLAALSGIL
jgi:hypothetical protein